MAYSQTDNKIRNFSKLLVFNKMRKDKLSIPIITPLPRGIDRPFWSVMIPTYNCAHYLAYTLRSVLEQNLGSEEMQIEVVDDSSTKDDIESVVKEVGKGRVSFFRQPHNVGAIANFNTCISRARGQWVHILHGDDTVLPEFYSRLRAGLEQEARVGAAFCRYLQMDENGHWQLLSPVERETPGILSDFLAPLAIMNRIMTPSIIVKRSVYEELGGFNLELFHSADWDMWKRIAVHYLFWYEPQPLACYRMHSDSDTSKLMRSGANITEACRAIEISESYLPNEFVTELVSRAKELHALKAMDSAARMLIERDRTAAIAQIRAGLKCSRSPIIIKALVNLLQKLTTDSTEFNLLPFTALDQFLAEFQSLASLYQDVEEYQKYSTNQSVLARLRQSRKQVADKWLNLPTENLEDMYLSDLGKAHKMLVDSGIHNVFLTDSEQNFVDEILEKLSQGFAQPKTMNYLLMAMLYRPINQLPLPSDSSQIPNWFLSDYLELIREQRLLLESLKLRNFNFIVFPDWLQPEESLGAELVNLLRVIATHPDKSQITLLIDTSNISDEDANMMLAAITMNLLIQEDLKLDEETEVSLVAQLSEIQWQALLPRLHARIVLKNENQQASVQAKVEKILPFEINNIENKRFVLGNCRCD